MSRIAQRRGVNTFSTDRPILSAAKFLGKGTEKAYIPAEQLLEFIDNGRVDDIQSLSKFFDLVKERLLIVVPTKIRTDRGGKPYKWPEFKRFNGPDGAKVVLIGNIDQFMVDFYNGKFITDFTLEDLVIEAEKA